MKMKNRYKNGKACQKTALLVLFTLLLVISLSFGVKGFSSYANKLPDHGENYSCSTCHSSGKLNEFGVDFKENDKKYDDALAIRDSDGDGFTNGEEFNATPPSNPGDANSYPGVNITNNSTENITDTSAYLGPIDMKAFVHWLFVVLVVGVIGGLIGLVIAEVTVSIKQKLRRRKQKAQDGGKTNEKE